MLESKRQQTEGGANKVYRGLPVTSIAFLLPLAFWLQFLLTEMQFLVLLHVLMAGVGFLFILDFTIKKPDLKTILILIFIVLATVSIIFMYTKYNLPHHKDRSNPVVEEIIEDIYE